VLIVDDENANILALTQILGQEYIVYAAKSGPDAIEVANEYLPDVILMDIIMSGMDGYEVIAELKCTDKTRNIPVIFITGLNTFKDEEKGLALGAADYINKPFSPAIVKLRVRNQIRIQNYIETITRLGMTDELTSLPNRRSFDERMRLEWGRAMRDKKNISIIMLDIDKFKDFNDTYGHQHGDDILKTAADIFKCSVRRSGDFVARYGGEEFVILLSDTVQSGAAEIAERIRKEVEDTVIPFTDGKTARITVSIGVNTEIPTTNSISEFFIKRADDALYAAKNGGRNRVCLYE